MTTSSSNHHTSAFLGDSGVRDLGSVAIDIEQKASTTVERSEGKRFLIISQSLVTNFGLQLVDLEARQEDGLSLFRLLYTLPIIGRPIASLIEKSFPNGTDSVEGMPDIDPDDLKALQAAIAEVSRALGQADPTALEVPSAVQSVNGTTPTTMSNEDGLNTDGSMSTGFSSTSAALAATNTGSSLSRPSAADGSSTMGGATSTQTPSESAPAPQSSPTIPGNPPNSPVPSAAYVG